MRAFLVGAVCSFAMAVGPSAPLYNAAAPGMRMSASGLGTGGQGCYNATGDGLGSFNASLSWLQLGGRRFDGAISYGCDRGIGAAVRDPRNGGVRREDVFITSKVGPGGLPYPLGYNDTLRQAAQILADLNTTYVDLLLVHEPFSYWPTPSAASRAPSSDPACAGPGSPTYEPSGKRCRLSTWRAMVALWRSGRARAIGVSNYNSTHLAEIEQAGLPLPSVNQLPFSPLHGPAHAPCACGHSTSRATAQCGSSMVERAETCAALSRYMKSRRILYNGYSPFGGGGDATAALLNDSGVREIGAAHNVTAAQVVLNWQWTRWGVAVNPDAETAVYQRQNLHFAGFQLTDSEAAVLDAYPQAPDGSHN